MQTSNHSASFRVRGNHDSFSAEIGKSGIPQGILWAQAVQEIRGKAYKKAMDRFYDLLPYIALSKNYVACHAAPPKGKVTMDMLVNIQDYPGLIEEVTCNRLYRPNRLAGYTKGDVKRFRKPLSTTVRTTSFLTWSINRIIFIPGNRFKYFFCRNAAWEKLSMAF